MNIDDLKREADIELTDVTATDIRKVIDYLASRGYLPSVQRIDGLDEAINEFIETVKDCVGEIHYPHKDVLKAARGYEKLQDGEAITTQKQEWRPIDKNTPTKEKIMIGCWFNGVWYEDVGTLWGKHGRRTICTGFRKNEWPTHWMPLPMSPKED